MHISTTVRRLVNNTQGATYVTLRPLSERHRTWAAGFAHTDVQRAELSGEAEQRMFSLTSNLIESDSTMMMAAPVKSFAEEQSDLERGDDFRFSHFRSRRCAAGDKQYGAALDPSLDMQTVAVNFTM